MVHVETFKLSQEEIMRDVVITLRLPRLMTRRVKMAAALTRLAAKIGGWKVLMIANQPAEVIMSDDRIYPNTLRPPVLYPHLRNKRNDR